MGWRKLLITKSAKLSVSNNCIIVNQEQDEKKIPIDQIESIMIESQQVNLTSSLLCKLAEKGISVVFCDTKHNPLFETVSYHNHTYFPKNIDIQTKWTEERKGIVWLGILQEKITNQAMTLKRLGLKEYKQLVQIVDTMTVEDCVSAEALAARIYFQALFGYDFRRRTEDDINYMLNYGYSIILSAVNRSIVQHGYLTAIGVGHHSCVNPFNLSCDIMEPFRPYIDLYVYEHKECAFSKAIRKELISLSNKEIMYDGTETELETAIDKYVVKILEKMNT